ncbi:MAG: hypothetical protein IPL33_22390 [Sphingobacteriales bacterium]|nr:hypothetical protein [Sphingobacteriales bacterium]
MKAFLPLLLLALLCCRCKNDEPIESCNPHCLMGFVCDPETGECICPEGNILYRGGCVPIKDYMYLPAPDNPNSDCFKYITAMWVDTSSGFSTLLRFKEDTPYGQSYDFNFFPLTTNPDTTSEWAYLQKFVADTKALPCLLDSNQVNSSYLCQFR